MTADIQAGGGDVSRGALPLSSEAESETRHAGLCTSDADGTLLKSRQASAAYLGRAGIVWKDLEAAVGFYRDGLGMEEKPRSREDRDEVVMRSAVGAGSDVVR